ncbi:hypothetical protein D3C72_1559620 [compost metagenome]
MNKKIKNIGVAKKGINQDALLAISDEYLGITLIIGDAILIKKTTTICLILTLLLLLASILTLLFQI